MEAANTAAIDAIGGRLTAAKAPIKKASSGIETADPWGTRIRIVKA